MGNRHHHKKLRARVRAVMSQTGESYQRALTRLQAQTKPKRADRAVDLLAVEYFGAKVTLATFEILERLACVVIPSGVSGVSLRSPLFALQGRRIVH